MKKGQLEQLRRRAAGGNPKAIRQLQAYEKKRDKQHKFLSRVIHRRHSRG